MRQPARSASNCWGVGQSTLEYAVFTTVVSAALLAMGIYVKRAIQANLKEVEDRVNADAAGP